MQSLVTLFMARRLPLGMLGSLVASGLMGCHLSSRSVHGMFTDRSDLIPFSTRQLNYGVAVADVDGDGEMEWIVAGFSGPNMVLKLNKATGYYDNLATEDNEQFRALRDPQGQAIGVCACDIDGDGREEIYFLNTNDRYSGPKRYKDKLFKLRPGPDGRERYENLFDDPGNNAALSMFAGRSVAAVDRSGTGRYSIILATYAERGQGSFGLIEMDEGASDVNRGRIVLRNVAQEAGIAMSTGGRGITVGPIVGIDGHSDIFFDNEGSYLGNDPRNALFVNDGTGHFTNRAEELGLSDRYPGRGVALADFNNDGRIDIVYGNWMAPHKLMIQHEDGTFTDESSPEMAAESPIRTVIAADFDNDGALEVFYNNIVNSRDGRSETWKNRLFRVAPGHSGGVSITQLDIRQALEPLGYGTGGAVADMDGDGRLELLLSHGESNSQDLTLYHVNFAQNSNWLRVMPLTRHNAPARGAKVTIILSDDTRLTRVVDGGSGYLCQMEPVAHFGMGSMTAKKLMIQWPDGSVDEKGLTSEDQNKMHRVPPPPSSPSRGGGGSRMPEGSVYQVGESHRGGSRTGGAGASHTDVSNRRMGVHTPSRGASVGSGSSQRGANAGTPYRGSSSGTPQRGSSSGTPNRGSSSGTPYRGSSSGTPYRGSSSGTPQRGSSSGTPNRGSSSGTPNRGSSSGTPYRGSSSGTPNRGSSSGTPYRGSSSGTPQRGSSSGTPYRGSHSGTPYRGSSSGTPHRGSSSGTPYRGSSSGTPNRGSYSGTPHRGSSSGTPHRGSSSGTPHRGYSSGTPHRGSSSGTPHRGYSSGTPYRGSSSGSSYRGSSSGTPNRGSSSGTRYRGSSSGTPYRGSSSGTRYSGSSSGIRYRGSSSGTPNRGSSSGTPYSGSSSRIPNRGSGSGTPYRGSSSGTPYRGSSSGTRQRGSSSGTPNRGPNARANNNEDVFNRRTSSRVRPSNRRDPSGASNGGASSAGSVSRPDRSGSEGSCTTTRIREYVRDDTTGCYSARPIRMGQCQGLCTGGSCCRPRHDRYRNILFACRNGNRYRKVSKAGVQRCRCVRCPA